MFLFAAEFAHAEDKSTPAPAAVVAATDVQAAMAMPASPARDTALKAAVTVWATKNPVDAMNYGVTLQDKGVQRTVVETAAKSLGGCR